MTETNGKTNEFVSYFYERYQGRIAIGVGYTQNMSEIYPLVFQNRSGESIGVVALGIAHEKENVVYIYHLGAFVPRRGNGSIILKELCRQADRFKISLSVSAIPLFSEKGFKMTAERLTLWYRGFGFKGDTGLIRKPDTARGK